MKRPFEEYHLHVSSAGHRPRDPGDRLTTRREILAATDRLLRRHPYSELTAEALAAESGISTVELAEHFEDVTEVVLSLLTEMGLELYGVAERWLQDAQIEQEAELGFNAAARVWLRAIVDFFYRNGVVVRTLSEASLTDERIARAYNGFLDRFTELTAFGLDRMVTDGRIEPLDPWPVARALNMMNERYLLAEFGHGQQGKPDAALKTLETIWLRAFAPTVVERRAH
jgi:TetR/AcrR family transcriptional regulator, ethionamide resistance regulator